MKLEEMTKGQLIATIKDQWKTIAQLELESKTAWSRYENSNRLVKSYMNEFADRGLIYIPKTGETK